MKKWFKQQLTEFTAWIGFLMIVCAILHVPYWIILLMGVGLISWDDDKAKAWCAGKAPKVASWLEQWKKDA